MGKGWEEFATKPATADFVEIGMSESEQLINDIHNGVDAICSEFPMSYWRDLDRNREYPSKFVKKLSSSGYLAALIPEEYGGSELGLRTALEILKRIHHNGANAAACHAQMYIMGTLLKYGSRDQKQKYLPGIACGDIRLQAFGVTEPNSGTDTLSLGTFAKKIDSGYTINGQKIWTSRAEHSDLLLLLARTTPIEQVAKKTDGLSVFLIDLREVSSKHIQIKPIRTMINHSTTEIFIEDLDVEQKTLIGEEGEGFKYILSGMNAERILVAAECIGDAQWFIHQASEYGNNRILFNAPISKNQGIQFPISKSYAHMKAAELMVHYAADKFDNDSNDGESANIAKLLAADASWMAAEACLQTFGGFGFAEEYDIERKYRETRLYQIAPISTNMILSYIGEKILGMPKSYG